MARTTQGCERINDLFLFIEKPPTGRLFHARVSHLRRKGWPHCRVVSLPLAKTCSTRPTRAAPNCSPANALLSSASAPCCWWRLSAWLAPGGPTPSVSVWPGCCLNPPCKTPDTPWSRALGYTFTRQESVAPEVAAEGAGGHPCGPERSGKRTDKHRSQGRCTPLERGSPPRRPTEGANAASPA